MIIVRGIIAVGLVIFAFILYPHYLNFIKAIQDIATSLGLTMNIYENIFFTLLPFITLLLIGFGIIMYLIGKTQKGGER